MLRPNYNEVPQGFSFDQTTLLTGTLTATAQVAHTRDIDCVSHLLSGNITGARLVSGGTYRLDVVNGDQGGVGALIGAHASLRECYHYSMSGITDHINVPLAFIGALETAHSANVLQTVRVLSSLPTRTYMDANQSTFLAEGLVRPSTDPAGYAQIANLVGYVFGFYWVNKSGATINNEFDISINVVRLSDPDVDLHTPVV